MRTATSLVRLQEDTRGKLAEVIVQVHHDVEFGVEVEAAQMS